MLDKPPMYPTSGNPYTICGDGMRLLVDHYKKAICCTNPDEFDRYMAKAFDQKSREMVSDMYGALRMNGFYPVGIKGDHLEWATVTDLRPDWASWQEIEHNGPPSKARIAEMKKECRVNLDRFCAGQVPIVTQAEIDQEIPF